MLDMQPIARARDDAARGFAAALARHVIGQAALSTSAAQALRRKARVALDGLRTLLKTRPAPQPVDGLDAATARKLARLSISAMALECCALRPDVDPLVTDIGWRELRLGIAEAHLEALGIHSAVDGPVAQDYVDAVAGSSPCTGLRDRLAARLLSMKEL